MIIGLCCLGAGLWAVTLVYVKRHTLGALSSTLPFVVRPGPRVQAERRPLRHLVA